MSAAWLTSSLISLPQGPASVSGQIWKVLPAGTLRMTVPPASHAAAQASAKAWRKKRREAYPVGRCYEVTANGVVDSWYRCSCWRGCVYGEQQLSLAYLGVVHDAVADGAEVVEREEGPGLGGVRRQENRGDGREQKREGSRPRHH
jgi:hypothetical protein